MDQKYTIESLARKLELWNHRIPKLSKYGDAGLLHEKATELATEMMNYEDHGLWEIVNQLPEQLR